MNRLDSIIWDHACGQQDGESDPRDRLLLAQLAGHCDEEGVESTRGPKRRACGCWRGFCCRVCAPQDGRFLPAGTQADRDWLAGLAPSPEFTGPRWFELPPEDNGGEPWFKRHLTDYEGREGREEKSPIILCSSF